MQAGAYLQTFDQAGIKRPPQASYLLRITREFLRTFGRAASSYIAVVDESTQRPCGHLEEEMPKMMSLWSSYIREQKCTRDFAGQPANTLPVRHWRL